MLTVGKFAFNRPGDTRRREYPQENLPAIVLSLFVLFSLYFLFFSTVRSVEARDFQYCGTLPRLFRNIFRTYREAPIHDGSSRSSADDVSRV